MLGAIAGTDKDDSWTAEARANMPKSGDYTKHLDAKSLKGTRIGYSQEDLEGLGPDQQALFQHALDDLEKQEPNSWRRTC